MSTLKLVLLFAVSILQFNSTQTMYNNVRLESYQNITKAGRKRNGVRCQNKVTYFIHQQQCRFYQRLDQRGDGNSQRYSQHSERRRKTRITMRNVYIINIRKPLV